MDAVRFFPLILIAAIVLAYANSFSGGFLFDDNRNIAENWRVREFSPRETVRPVAILSFAVNYALSGLHPADYRATNIAIHILAALFLYGLVRRTLMLPRLRERYGEAAPWLAFAIAAIWAVHPLQTQSVTYIVQRIEALMGLFYLLTLYAFVRAYLSPRPAPWSILAALACALGMGTKQVMVTAPLVVLLYDAVFLSTREDPPWRRRKAVHAGIAASWLCLWALYRFNAGDATLGGGVLPRMQYFITQFGVILRYLRLAVWPHGLCLDYVWSPATRAADFVPQGLAVGALGLAALAALRFRPGAGFLACSFFIVLATTSSLLPIPDMIFEHRMYLPLAPVVALLVLGAYGAGRRVGAAWSPAGRTALGVGSLAAVLAALAVSTAVRNRAYASETVMWLDVVAKRPDNYRARLGAAVGLMNEGRFDESIAQCGAVLEALPDFRQTAFSAFPAEAHNAGEGNMLAAQRLYCGAQGQLAQTLFRQGRAAEAVPHYEESLRLGPDDRRQRAQYGLALFYLKRVDEAVRQWAEALAASNPRMADYPELRAYLGHAALEQRLYAVAREHLVAALAADRGRLSAQYDLALLLAAAPGAAERDGPRALELAKAVCAAAGEPGARALDILAAAQAECGDFAAALATLELAVERARLPAAAAVVSAADLLARRQLYLAGKPYRLPAPEEPVHDD